MRWWLLAMGLSAALVSAACSKAAAESKDSANDAGEVGDDDDVVGDDDDLTPDAGSSDAPKPTKKTTAVVDINGVKRTLERGQFGTTKDGADETLYVEAHEGGVEACPETETPKRTMIVSNVPLGAVGDSFDEGDGVTVSFLDFTGDQITTDNPTTKATKAKVTLIAYGAEDSVEIEVEATFDEGTAKGRVFATYCEAMSDTK